MFERLLGLKRNEVCDWNFKCVSPEDFELVLKMKPSGFIMGLFLRMAKSNIKGKTGSVDAVKVESVLDGLVLPVGYNNLVGTSCKPVLKDVYNKVGVDGVVVVRDCVDRVQFFKEGDGWRLVVFFKGVYCKKVV